MSLKHFNAIRDSGLLKGAAYQVALMLAVRTNEYGVCWPSYTTIAKEARVSGRSARDAVKKLERQGLLSVDRKSRKTNSYRLEVVAFEMAAKNRHYVNERRVHTPRSTKLPLGGNLTTTEGATSSPKYIGNTKNLNRAVTQSYDTEEIFDLLSESWAWKTEGKFAVRATQIGGSGITDTWFKRGRPTFVLFIDPLRTQGRECEGLSISFSESPGDPDLIERILRTMGFDDDPIWRWDVFIDRLSNPEMPPLEPVPVVRLVEEENWDAA